MASSLARFRCSHKATTENVDCPYIKPARDTSQDELFPIFTKHLYVSSFPMPVPDRRREDKQECDPKKFFNVTTCLGTGRMGKTYIASHPDYKKYPINRTPKRDASFDVALTQIDAKTVDFVDAVRILEPFTLHHHKNHPLICKALLSFRSRVPYQIVNYFILSEYWKGETSLCKRLQALGRMSHDVARFYILELTDMLMFIHSYGKIVRNLCPCSIIIRPTGHLVLAPYTLCDQNFHCGQPCNMLVKNCGDQFYAAPEIVFGVDVQFAADWWSMGVLMFQLVTGHLPFNGRTLGDLGKCITESDLDIPGFMEPEAASYIKSLLHKDARRRLGFGASGSTDIQRHPYNAGVRWEDVRYLVHRPPFVPHEDGGFPLCSDTGEKPVCRPMNQQEPIKNLGLI